MTVTARLETVWEWPETGRTGTIWPPKIEPSHTSRPLLLSAVSLCRTVVDSSLPDGLSRSLLYECRAMEFTKVFSYTQFKPSHKALVNNDSDVKWGRFFRRKRRTRTQSYYLQLLLHIFRRLRYSANGDIALKSQSRQGFGVLRKVSNFSVKLVIANSCV